MNYRRVMGGAARGYRGSIIAAALVGVTALTAPAYAHQTFLLPAKFQYSKGEFVAVSLTSALSFPNMEHGPAKDRIAYAKVSVGGLVLDEVSFEERQTSLALGFSAHRLGGAVIAISSKPRAGEIPPEEVRLYLDEIEAEESVRAAFDALPGSPPLQRSYAKHAKAFICIATCGSPKGFASPVDQKLEFVAASDKSFRLLRDGEPVAGKKVTIMSIDGEMQKSHTDSEGVVRVSESASGIVMLSAVSVSLPEKADGVYHSDYATLTIDLDMFP